MIILKNKHMQAGKNTMTKKKRGSTKIPVTHIFIHLEFYIIKLLKINKWNFSRYTKNTNFPSPLR